MNLYLFSEQSVNIVTSSQTTIIQATNTAQSLRQISTGNLQLNSIKQDTATAAVVSTTLPATVSNQTQQIIPESEQFAVAWLRATFEPVNVTNRIEQQDLYKMYLTASSKVGRSGVVSPLHFPRCVRSVFGNAVGPNTVKLKQSNMETHTMYYESIRIRPKPLAVIHKGTVLQASVQTSDLVIKKPEIQSITKLSSGQVGPTNNSIFMTQVSGKNVNILILMLFASNLANDFIFFKSQHQSIPQQPTQILQHVLSNQTGESLITANQKQQSLIVGNNKTIATNFVQQQQQQPTVITSTHSTAQTCTSTSLIKSLLANKVPQTQHYSQSIDNSNSATTTAVVTSGIITNNLNMHQQVTNN